jgi:hypothetical protein
VPHTDSGGVVLTSRQACRLLKRPICRVPLLMGAYVRWVPRGGDPFVRMGDGVLHLVEQPDEGGCSAARREAVG